MEGAVLVCNFFYGMYTVGIHVSCECKQSKDKTAQPVITK